MSMVIKAHFDGKVFVPDEPVNLPVGEPLLIEFQSIEPVPSVADIDARKGALEDFISLAVPEAQISPEALRRENMYEDRA